MNGLEAIEIIRDRLIEYQNKAEGTNIKCLISPQFAQVRIELKAFEIIKEKNVNMFGFKRDIKQLGNRFTYKYYQSNLGNYHSGFDIQELTEEEFELLRSVLE